MAVTFLPGSSFRFLMLPMGIEADDDSGKLIEHLRTRELPENFERINDNVQTVRGVIDQDAYDLFNTVNRLRQAGSQRAACFQLQACHRAMVPDHEAVLDSTDLLRAPAVPESLLVVGAGAIGLEMADFFSAMRKSSRPASSQATSSASNSLTRTSLGSWPTPPLK